jgi:hypothetical protein
MYCLARTDVRQEYLSIGEGWTVANGHMMCLVAAITCDLNTGVSMGPGRCQGGRSRAYAKYETSCGCNDIQAAVSSRGDSNTLRGVSDEAEDVSEQGIQEEAKPVRVAPGIGKKDVKAVVIPRPVRDQQ